MTGSITIKPNRIFVTTILSPKKFYEVCFCKRNRYGNVTEECTIELTKKQLKELREEINDVLGDMG